MKRKFLMIVIVTLFSISTDSVILAQEKNAAATDKSIKWLQRAIISSNEKWNARQITSGHILEKIEFLPSDKCTLKYMVLPIVQFEGDATYDGLSNMTTVIPLARLNTSKLRYIYYEGNLWRYEGTKLISSIRYDGWTIRLGSIKDVEGVKTFFEPFSLKGGKVEKQPVVESKLPLSGRITFNSKADAEKAVDVLKNLINVCNGQATTATK